MIKADGWFIKDMLVWGELDQRGFISKGFELEVPDYRSASNNVKNEFHNKVNSLLRLTHQTSKKCHLQVQWSVNSNYEKELLAYDRDTDKLATNPWTRKVRKERHNRYMQKMKNRQLRREKACIYISTPITEKLPVNIPKKSLRSYYDTILEAKANFYKNYSYKLQSVFSTGDINIKPMGDIEHYLHLDDFLNPGRVSRRQYDRLKTFNPLKSIQQNCYHSGVKGNEFRGDSNDYGFKQDGNYHEVLVLKTWPGGTYASQPFYELTSLPFLDYSITANIYPVEVKGEKKKLATEIARLDIEMQVDKKSRSHRSSIETKDKRLQNYETGDAFPFEVQYIIRLWDKDKNLLAGKVEAMKAQIELLGGATYYQPANPVTQKKLFFMSWPGWIFGTYRHYKIPAQNDYLADMLPLSSTYTGMLDGAEAIYDGGMYNLVGIKNFIDGTPQMCSCFGMQGSGKSASVIDLLSQTECFYDYTCIVEEGNSYGTYVKLLGGKTLLVNPNSDFTLNYLDTRKLPLTTFFISEASDLAAKMCGTIKDEDKMRLRRAMLTHYVQQVYTDKFQYWRRNKEHLIPEIARYGISVNRYWKEHMPSDADFIEAWSEFKEKESAKDEIVLNLFSSVTEEEISNYIQKEKVDLRNMAYAWYEPDEYPIHSELCDVIETTPSDKHSEAEVKKIATLLGQWRAGEGDSGKIFDGISSVDITGRVIHFELGLTPKHMKSVVTSLINTVVRKHMMTLPRGSKKRIDYEEAGRLIESEYGEEILSESYAQWRKFNVWVLSIIQQYEKFKKSSIRATIIGNSKQLILLRQRDKGDLEDLAEHVEMPQMLKEMIMTFSPPEQSAKKAEDKYASFAFYQESVPHPLYGAVKNVISKEMLYVASTKGRDVEKRERELKSSKGELIDLIEKFANEKHKEEPYHRAKEVKVA